MGNDARRKQKQKLKRKQKRTSQRRAEGLSPYSKLKNAGEMEACYINEDWAESKIASILALRKLPGGGHAFGAFLVDLACLGLKDAWGRIDITMSEFRETIERSRGRCPVVPVAPKKAWELVAGGIRWAQENEFRLPPRYERWISVLGDAKDIASADVSVFGTENGLVYVGPLEDLRKRLLGCSVEEFLAREDVHYISPVGPVERIDDYGDLDADDLDEDELDEDELDEDELADGWTAMDDPDAEIEAAVGALRAKMLDAVRRFLFSKNIVPHPRLPEAVDLALESALQSTNFAADTSSELTEEEISGANENVERFLAMESPESSRELTAATDQLALYMQQFVHEGDMLKGLGIEDLPEE